jgi:hypothetical protein
VKESLLEWLLEEFVGGLDCVYREAGVQWLGSSVSEEKMLNKI